MGHVTPLFARQPIFDRNLNVVAYELLFRDGLDTFARTADGDQATSHVLLYAFGQHRIQEITGKLPAYINYTRHWLLYPPPLPPNQLVIEILEDVKPDDQVLEAIAELRKQGYRIALDDFFLNPDTLRLLVLADIIKIDVLALEESKWRPYVEYLRPHGVKLLAEKIESYEMYEQCKQLGFDYFQGYFLSKPHTIQGFKLSDSKNRIVQLLAVLTNPGESPERILATLGADALFVAQLLKLLDAVRPSDSPSISTLDDALRRLGLAQLRHWASFLALNSESHKTTELWSMCLTRAKFCEMVGARVGDQTLADQCFTVGTLSMFDAILGVPMRVLLASQSLPHHLSVALSEHAGPAGAALELVLDVEKANWAGVQQNPYIKEGVLSDSDITDCYTAALSWAHHIIRVYHPEASG